MSPSHRQRADVQVGVNVCGRFDRALLASCMEFVATYAYVEAQLNICVCAMTRGDPELIGTIMSEVWSPRVLDNILRRVAARCHMDADDRARLLKALDYVKPIRDLRNRLCHNTFAQALGTDGDPPRSDHVLLVPPAGFVDVVAGFLKASESGTDERKTSIHSDALERVVAKSEKAMRHEVKRAAHAHQMLVMAAALAGSKVPAEVEVARKALDRLLASRP